MTPFTPKIGGTSGCKTNNTPEAVMHKLHTGRVRQQIERKALKYISALRGKTGYEESMKTIARAYPAAPDVSLSNVAAG